MWNDFQGSKVLASSLNRSLFQKSSHFLVTRQSIVSLAKDHDWTDSHARSRVAGTMDRVVHAATNRVKTRVKDHPAQEQTVEGNRRMIGRTDGWRNETDRRSTRGAEKPCWCLPASDQVEWVVPSCSPSPYTVHLRVYSCKIMPTTSDVPATTPFFDATSIMWEKNHGSRLLNHLQRFHLQLNNAQFFILSFY